jgi:AhpC/TSA antioxidant enzyme
MQLHRAHKQIEDAGTRLVFIGQATPRHAAHFRRRFAPDVTILADEERRTYKLIGAPRGGTAELIGPGVVLKGIARGLKDRQVQGRPVGDVAQLGGTLLVMPDGSIPWTHMSRNASDNASVDEILQAVSSSPAAAR